LLADSYREVKQDERISFLLWGDNSDRQFGFWHYVQYFNGSSRNAGYCIESQIYLGLLENILFRFLIDGDDDDDDYDDVRRVIVGTDADTSTLTLHKYYTRV
jgi:hypothetical protein